MKTILITGGAGFIGSHVTEAFLQKGYKVIILDKVVKNTKKFSKNISLYNVDLNNSKSIKEIIEKEKPDIISHHASNLVGVKQSILSPQTAFQDIIMASNLFEAAKNTTVKQIIFSSSANIYDKKSSIPITEFSSLNPLSPYGITKLAIENYCEYLKKMWKMRFTILRYFNVYGPRQRATRDAGIIPLLINKSLRDQEVIINGTGKQTRDFSYVKDVAQANVLAAEKNIEGTFNVGTMREVSLNQLIILIEGLVGKKIKKSYRSDFDEIDRSLADNSRIKRYLKWHPKTSLKQGLEETFNYYKNIWEKK